MYGTEIRHGQFTDGSHGDADGRIDVTTADVFGQQYHEGQGRANRNRIARG
jgi:hypothetical protein